MIGQLTSSERQIAAAILLLAAGVGLAMAATGRHDPLGVHGVIVLLFSGTLLYPVLAGFYEPEPKEDREASYYDDPIKVGIVLTMAWAVFGMFMGVWVAAQLAWPDLACESAPKVNPFSKGSKYLILLGNRLEGGVIIGADRDPTKSPIWVSKSTAYAGSPWGQPSELIHSREA